MSLTQEGGLRAPDPGKEGSSVGKVPFDRQQATYCHVLVRADIPLPQQAVQAIHAAMAATAAYGGLRGDTRLALLQVRDQDELLAYADRLADKGVAFALFDEPDYGMGASALATAPGPVAQGRCLSRLPLWAGQADSPTDCFAGFGAA